MSNPQRLCRHCGDPLEEPHQVEKSLESIYITARAREMCIDCCAEIELGIVPKQTPTLQGTGGGRRVIRKGDPMT